METACYPFPAWVSETITDFYSETGVKKLFKWQSELLEKAHKSTENLVFSAPTSAGKSIVSELLAWDIADKNRKVLFVLPYISVAKEKLHLIQKCWRRVDMSVCGFIGPQATNPNEWIAAICTIEKSVSLLNRALCEEWFSEIGMIVIDEIHMIFDSSRGAHIEYMLSKVMFWNRNRPPSEKIRIIGMSATIPQLNRIGEWLNAQVFEADFRPIRVSENIVINREVKTIKNEYIEETVIRKFEVKSDPLLELAAESFQNDIQTLIMTTSKIEAEKIAVSIALLLSNLRKKDAKITEKLEKRANGLLFTKLGLERNGCKDRNIMSSLAWGIAFHHAVFLQHKLIFSGLTMEERECIETGFCEKSILILVATSTLASGVNLPAERVIIKSQTRGVSALTNMSYRQMIGRCGRMGHAKRGESFLVVRPSDEERICDIILNSFSKEQSSTKLIGRNLNKFILELISTGVVKNREEILEITSKFLLKSEDVEVCDSVIENLKLNAFIAESSVENADEYSSTQLGKAVIASSLPPDAALTIFEDLNMASRAIALDTELHMLYLVTPINVTVWQECDWHHLFAIFSKIPPDHRRVAKLVGVTEKFILEQMNGRSRDEGKLQVHIRYFSALALFDLISEKSIHEVSQKYRISRGCLQTLQSQSATYSAMIVAFCVRLGWTYLKSLLDGFSMRLLFGIRSELSELVTVDGIDGQRARILHEKGITCLSHLVSIEPAKLEHYLTLAVPFLSTNKNDGKGEWLFGEPRMKLQEAATCLKERARKMLIQRVQELGITVDIPKIENKKGEEMTESCDSGLGESCADSVMTEITQNVTEMSIIDDMSADEGNDEVFRNIEKYDDDAEESIVECLETSLLKLKPPRNEKLVKRLSRIFSPLASPKAASSFLSVDEEEDSFDLPVPGSVPLNNSANSKRNSIAHNSNIRRQSLDTSENCSFDVFSTPPQKEQKEEKSKKHPRITYMTNSPFSSYVSSPILKHSKIDPNRLFLEDVCSDLKNWNDWLKLIGSVSEAGVSFMENFQGISISTFGTTVFVPLLDDYHGVTSENLEVFANLEKCVVSLKNRIEAVKMLMKTTKVYIFSLEECYLLFEKFGIQIENPRIVSIMAHHNHLMSFDENGQSINTKQEIMKIMLSRIKDLQINMEQVYGSEKEEFRISVEAFAMKRIFESQKIEATANSSERSVKLEIEATKSVVRMFYTGISVDSKFCTTAITFLRKRIEQLEEECWKLAHGKFNLESSKSVANVMFCRLGLIYPEDTSIGSKSHLPTNKAILEQMKLQHEIVEKILEYRHIRHTLFNCLIQIDKILAKNKNRIHCWFEMATMTGRILTSNPNVQNVPKHESLDDGSSVRRMFEAKNGYVLIGADYCQLELRVLAHWSNDAKLVELIKNERDIFQDLSEIWNFPRAAVKQLCYGLIYGMGVKSLAGMTKMKLEEAEKMWKSFFEMFPKVRSYINETKEKAFRDGYVETILGRKRFTSICQLPEDKSREERIVVNYTIQGTASEIFKGAIVKINEKLRNIDAEIVMTVHDEIIVETAKDMENHVIEIIRDSMQGSLADILRVPMRVKIKSALSWDKLK